MLTLLLVRHGETDAIGDRLCGRMPGIGLNARGREQAQALAQRLAATRVTALFVSPLERARDTAMPLAMAQGLTPEIDPRLTDVDFGEWTGRSFAELASDPRWQAFNADRAGAAAPGGESLRDVQRRTLDVMAAAASRFERGVVALVTHAEIVRSALAHADSLCLDAALAIDVLPGSVHVLRTGAAREGLVIRREVGIALA